MYSVKNKWNDQKAYVMCRHWSQPSVHFHFCFWCEFKLRLIDLEEGQGRQLQPALTQPLMFSNGPLQHFQVGKVPSGTAS